MRFSLQPEQRPEQRMRTVSIDEILTLCERMPEGKPLLEHYFSPTRKEAFIKDYLHYLNSGLLEAKRGALDIDQYLVFILSFQFVAPLLEIPSEKELGLFYRILQKNYGVDEIDLNLHFSSDQPDEDMMGEKEALKAFRDELEETYDGIREVKESVHHRLKKDAIHSIMSWQRKRSLAALAEAFGRSIVIPSFFSFTDKKLVSFYRGCTEGMTYQVAIPEEIE